MSTFWNYSRNDKCFRKNNDVGATFYDSYLFYKDSVFVNRRIKRDISLHREGEFAVNHNDIVWRAAMETIVKHPYFYRVVLRFQSKNVEEDEYEQNDFPFHFLCINDWQKYYNFGKYKDCQEFRF